MSVSEDDDIIIVVKRTPPQLIKQIRDSGRPWVYDTVDGWPQPSTWGHTEAVYWLQDTINSLNPHAVVFGTHSMQRDSGFKGPSIVLPHHSWQRYMDAVPVTRQQIRVVGYEGSPKYLGKWHQVIKNACRDRGWDFVINGDMTQADIGVALRDGGGYPARYWKPGTKLSNLHALGIPAICTLEEGYQSVSSGAEMWVSVDTDVSEMFARLEGYELRKDISEKMRAAAITLDSVADTYKSWLKSLL